MIIFHHNDALKGDHENTQNDRNPYITMCVFKNANIMTGAIIRVCVIGAGRVGHVHGLNIKYRIPQADVVAVVDSNLGAAKELAEKLGKCSYFASLSEALSKVDFDAVVITTPTFTHCPLTLEAAEAGKHVFSEKPIALNLEEADKMINATRKRGLKLQIGFMRRFDPDIRKAKSLIDDKAIGKPVLIKSLSRGPGLPPEWALDPKKGIGMLVEVSIHDFDSVRWLMGSEVKSVYAVADALIRPDLKSKYELFHDVYAVLQRFENGGIGVIDGGCPVGYGYDARLEILGTEGLITIGEVRGTSLFICKSDKKAITETFQSWRDRFREGYLREIESFISSIIEDKEPEVTGEDGKKALEACLAAVESLKTGKQVSLPL
ncbi:MAG: Gfo/Idh/MocA family oxidoreductase [Aigarchaeota archaeon]|nr:Gfo/Idh/MocA family oxidoreductase [Aigarchaeota archaeon]